MTSDEILVYSEYLSRIKSIALSIQIPENCIAEKLTFQNVKTGVLHYREKVNDVKDDLNAPTPMLKFFIHFPEDISVRISESTLPISVDSSTLSFRLPASPELVNNSQTKLNFYDNSDLIPWSAGVLNNQNLTITCVNCNNIITNSNYIHQWKPLPSENWHEMMDFWHCHKPNEDNNSFNPSYSISKFVPYSKTALVGDCYFYIIDEDMIGIKVVGDSVNCGRCGFYLGSSDEQNSLTIWKWNIKMNEGIQDVDKLSHNVTRDNTHKTTTILTTYPLHLYVSTVLARLIDSHAIYTFSITDMNETPFLLLWVFNPDIKYSTNYITTKGFKIVYCFDTKLMPQLEKTRNEIEKVKFPKIVLSKLKSHILQNTESLPGNARTFGKWNVSMLEKITL